MATKYYKLTNTDLEKIEEKRIFKKVLNKKELILKSTNTLEFNGVEIDEKLSVLDKTIKYIRIRNSKIQSVLIGGEKKAELELTHNCEFGSFEINCIVDDIKVSNCKFHNFEISRSNGNFLRINDTISDHFKINNSQVRIFEVSNCMFETIEVLRLASVQVYIRCAFSNLILTELEEYDILQVQGLYEGPDISDERSPSTNKVKLDTNFFGYTKFEKIDVLDFSINGRISNGCYLLINYCEIAYLELTNVVNLGKLIIQEIFVYSQSKEGKEDESGNLAPPKKIKSQLMSKLSNELKKFDAVIKSHQEWDDDEYETKIPEYKVNKKGKLIESHIYISDSILNDTVFSSVEFDRYESIYFIKSDVSNISTISNHIPYKKVETPFDRKIEQLINLKDIYIQLYQAMKRHGNQDMSQLYYYQYMECIRKIALRKFQFGTLFALLLSRISSIHGRKWYWGAFGTLIVSLIFYAAYLYVINLGPLERPVNQANLAFYFGKYWEFLYPGHKFNFIKDNPGPGAAIDLMGRVFIGYWIYQTVTAFRRYGRK